MKKVLATYPLPAGTAEKYADRIALTIPDAPMSYEELCRQAGAYDAVFLVRNRADRVFLQANSHLLALANFAVGYDNIDVACATENGIPVINTPLQVTETTAELAVALILDVMRGITRYDKQVRQGIWDSPLFGDENREVHGRLLGIVGMGRIGTMVAQKAVGLGMRVIYHNRHRLPIETETALGVQYASLDELLQTSDCVSLNLPYTPEKEHMFGAAQFAQMRPDAYFVNTARGRLVDEKALAAALQQGIIKGAGLDVFEDEPQVYAGLLGLDNVVLCPHIGSCTIQTRTAMMYEALDGLCDVLEGKRPHNLVNP